MNEDDTPYTGADIELDSRIVKMSQNVVDGYRFSGYMECQVNGFPIKSNSDVFEQNQ